MRSRPTCSTGSGSNRFARMWNGVCSGTLRTRLPRRHDEVLMTPAVSAPRAALDVAALRADFPILLRRGHGRPLVYLDNAATTQKPQSVIDRLACYYREENANIHRGVHLLSVEATDAYDAGRARVARFLNAAEAREIVFVRGTT